MLSVLRIQEWLAAKKYGIRYEYIKAAQLLFEPREKNIKITELSDGGYKITIDNTFDLWFALDKNQKLEFTGWGGMVNKGE